MLAIEKIFGRFLRIFHWRLLTFRVRKDVVIIRVLLIVIILSILIVIIFAIEMVILLSVLSYKTAVFLTIIEQFFL